MLLTLTKRESALWQPFLGLAGMTEGFLVILCYLSCYSNILVV